MWIKHLVVISFLFDHLLSSPSRVNLNCSIIYGSQEIGILNGSPFPYHTDVLYIEPFLNSILCAGRIKKLTVKDNAEGLASSISITVNDGNAHEFQKGASNDYTITTSVNFNENDVIKVSNYVGIQFSVETEGSKISISNKGSTITMGLSVAMTMTVVVKYDCTEWSNVSTICVPIEGFNGNGTYQKNRTCEDSSEEILQIEVTDCVLEPEWKLWSEWSFCTTIDGGLCGVNSTQHRHGVSCYDTIADQIIDNEWCGDEGYHIQSCEVYCPEEYAFHRFLWRKFGECTIYEAGIQGNQNRNNSHCGNGFHQAQQSTCIAGDEWNPPQNDSFCPHPGIHVRNCYTPCDIASPAFPSVPKVVYSNDDQSLITPFEDSMLNDTAPFQIYGFFDPALSLTYSNNIYSANPTENQVDFYIFFNKFVYVSHLSINFDAAVSSAINANHNFELTFTKDGQFWESHDRSQTQQTLNSSILQWGSTQHTDSWMLCSGVKVKFISIKKINPVISAKYISITYQPTGNFVGWGNWTGNCTDANCWQQNVTWSRENKCEVDGKLVDLKYCYGMFYDVEQCKCPYLYQWNLKEDNFGNCTSIESYNFYDLGVDSCGNGFEYYIPESCEYDGDTLEDKEYWRCGDKPIQARDCFEPCPKSCNGNGVMLMTNTSINPELDERHMIAIDSTDVIDGDSVATDIEVKVFFAGTMNVEVFLQTKAGLMQNIYTEAISSSPSSKKLFGPFFLNTNLSEPLGYSVIRQKPLAASVDKVVIATSGCGIPRWYGVNYTDCLALCGNGTITGYYTCRDAQNTTYFPDVYCKDEKPDDFDEECFTGIVCYTYTDWTDWTDCDGNCGRFGFKNKTRDCLADGVLVQQADCLNASSPLTVFSETEPCYIDTKKCYNWTEWNSWQGIPTCDNSTILRYRTCQEDSGLGGYLERNHSWVDTSHTNCSNELGDSNEDKQIYYSGTHCYMWTKWSGWSAPPICDYGDIVQTRTCLMHESGDKYVEENDVNKCLQAYPNQTDKLTETVHTSVSCARGVSLWSDWSGCSRPCNGGELSRWRECTGSPEECRSNTLHEEQLCNQFACPIDGYWTDYTTWTPCSVSCGRGVQQHQRECIQPVNNGTQCTNFKTTIETETRDCDTQIECPGLSLTNTSCSKYCDAKDLTCATSMKAYTATKMEELTGIDCINGHTNSSELWHPAVNPETNECFGFDHLNMIDCHEKPESGMSRICNCIPQDEYVMGEWSGWGICSTTCGLGVKTRFRSNVDIEETDKFIQEGHCMMIGCPVDGAWSEWSGFGDCNVTCGFGYKTRTRECNNPEARHQGSDCAGVSYNLETCGDPSICPQNGEWSNWERISDCSRWCKWPDHEERANKSVQTFKRKCDNPIPEFGGRTCNPDNGITDTKFVECTNLPICRPAVLNITVEFVKEHFDTNLEYMDSITAETLKQKIVENLRNVYKYHHHTVLNPKFFAVKFHEFRNGTGKGTTIKKTP